MSFKKCQKKFDSDLLNKAIAFLAVVQIMICCVPATNLIQKGDSTINSLTQILNSSIFLLKQVKSNKKEGE